MYKRPRYNFAEHATPDMRKYLLEDYAVQRKSTLTDWLILGNEVIKVGLAVFGFCMFCYCIALILLAM